MKGSLKHVGVYLFLVIVVYFVGRQYKIKHFAALTLAVTVGVVYLLNVITVEDLDQGRHAEFILAAISGIIIAAFFLYAILKDKEPEAGDINISTIRQVNRL
jgi:hypothetical protein